MSTALEKRWFPVLQLFTSDGNTDGLVTVADTTGFFSKQTITIKSNTQPPKAFQVNIVISATQMYVGLPKSNIILDRTDVSAYKLADAAQIYAPSQSIGQIQPPEIFNAVYARDPVVALRTVLVDAHGQWINEANPVPVNAVVNVPPGTIPTQWDDIDLGYDANQNLNEVQYFLDTILIRTLNLSYDSNGNLIEVTATPSPA